MKIKPLLILITFLVWASGSTYWYVCKIKGFCTRQEQVSEVPPVREQESGNKPEQVSRDILYYQKDNDSVFIDNQDKWTAEVKSIAQLKAEGKKLRIEAPYYENENNETRYDNLGLARAENVKKMIGKVVDTSLIITAGRRLTSTNESIPEFINGYKDYIKWVTFNDFVKENNQGKVLIYFPVNSNREIKNETIKSYLNELTNKLKNHPDYQLEITGYTDNTGSAGKNKQLGLSRAKRIKDILTSKGIEYNRIIVKSEGENNPIADNNTAEGRQKNRRVEIIIKK
jgi:OOP family OmpA-OmpF porin